jgi:hypothetical protein
VTGAAGRSALADTKAIGIDLVPDYAGDIPAALGKRFEIVLDTNGSLTPAQRAARVKRGGLVIGTHPSAQKVIRSLFSRRRMRRRFSTYYASRHATPAQRRAGRFARHWH